MAYSYCTNFLLGVKDPNLVVDGDLHSEEFHQVRAFRSGRKANSPDLSRDFQQVLSISGHLSKLPKACPHCGCVNQGSADMIQNGTLSTAILIGQYNFQPVYLKLKKQRYYCKHCQHTTLATSPIIDAYCHISNPLKFLILEELTKQQSMTLIAQHLNVSTNTVIRQLKNVGDNRHPIPTHLPEHLAVDEFKSVKSVEAAMSCILMDNASHRIVDILEDRKQESLRQYFLQFSPEERGKVKTITIDMYQPYRKLFQTLFPNAEMIIDRFHVVQLLNRALNQIRIQLMRNIRYQRPRDYTKLKRLWKLILKRRDELDFQHYHTHRLFDGLVTEQSMVNYLLNLDDKLYRAYHLTHQLIEVILSHSHQAFERVLQEGRKYSLPRPLRTAWNTLFDYQAEIHHSLTYTLSNGPVEGINHKIKNIKRSGYGYRNFGHLRCRILLSCQLFSQEEAPYRHIFYNDEHAVQKYNRATNA